MGRCLDQGQDHESKISEKELACAPLSGYNHLAVFLRWAYQKGMIREEVFEKEPRLEPAMKGAGDLREVLADSAYLKGRVRSDYFTEECRIFAEWFYAFGRSGYPHCVDQHAEAYFGTEKYHCAQFKDEAYLFVPYDEAYYQNLSKYIDAAWENRPPKLKGQSVGKEKLDDILDVLRRESETDAVFIKTETGDANLCSSKIGGLPYWPKDKEYPTDSNGNKLILLAQINLSDFKFEKLPDKGLLQFFVADDDVLGLDGPKGYKVVYHEKVDLQIREEDVRSQGIRSNADLDDESYMFPVQASIPVSFTIQKDHLQSINDGFDEIVSRVLNEKYGYQCDSPWRFLSKEDYGYLEQDAPEANHKMFGYPFFTQGDPRNDAASIEKYDTLLFQLDSEFSEGRKEICIGDAGVINFFINSRDLAERNFEDVLYYWDCY